MIFGLLAGELLRSRRSPRNKLAMLAAAGVVGLAVGWALGALGVCPVVKRLWTPSWALYSAGWSLLLLALFYAATDVARLRRWALPLVVVGMNSIAIYCMSMLLKPWVRDNLRRHFGANVFDILGKPYVPMVEAAAFLLVCWAACWWMYRRKVFLKI
jgi:predicted acyltransferase